MAKAARSRGAVRDDVPGVQASGAPVVKQVDDIHAFWSGGRDEALRALREQYAARIAALESQIYRAGDSAERDRLLMAIKSARKELAKKEKDLRWSLFGRT